MHLPKHILEGGAGFGTGLMFDLGDAAVLGRLTGRSSAVCVLEQMITWHGEQQPAQATFENRVAASLQLNAAPLVLVEDEARHVGRVLLPKELWQRIKRAPIALLDGPDDERVARIAAEYVFEPSGGAARAAVKERLLSSIHKLHKRLGGAMTQACVDAIERADDGDRWFSVEAHDPWIRPLLVDYYDKHYRQELARYPREAAFQGDIPSLVRWLAAGGAGSA